MNKKWQAIKIIIAIIFILWGLFRTIFGVIHIYDMLALINSPFFPPYTSFELIKSSQPGIAISLFTLIAGVIFLFSKKKMGWYFAMATCFIHIAVIADTVTSPVSGGWFTLQSILLVTGFTSLFVLIIIALVQKPIIEKITIKDWAISFFLSSIVIVDLFYFS